MATKEQVKNRVQDLLDDIYREIEYADLSKEERLELLCFCTGFFEIKYSRR